MTVGTLVLELPSHPARIFTDLVLDYSGTIAHDGVLISDVAERIRRIAAMMRVLVLTADTFGRAGEQLKGLPIEMRVVETGADKANLVKTMKPERTIAIGNGRNDIPMIKLAGLGIAVIGPEGACAALLAAADIVVRDIRDALELVEHPLRLKATLRA